MKCDFIHLFLVFYHLGVNRAEECIIGDAVCRNKFGSQSYCVSQSSFCYGPGGATVVCTCGQFLEPVDSYRDLDDENLPGFPFLGRNYPNMTIIANSSVSSSVTFTTSQPATTVSSPSGFVPSSSQVSSTSSSAPRSSSTTLSVPRSTSTTSYVSSSLMSSQAATTVSTTSITSTSTTTTTTTTTTILITTTTTTTTTQTRTKTNSTTTTSISTSTSTTTVVAPVYDGSSMFLWVEWPTMTGESDWVRLYSALVEFVSTSRLNINKIILRVLDPTIGLVSNTPQTQHDLWTVSNTSVLYRAFLTKLPSTVKTFDVYPYLLDTPNQNGWMASMGTNLPLEGVFKYCKAWNDLLSDDPSTSVRCGGVTVDGEEKKGYLSELSSVPAYKASYKIGFFGYATGYTQVGVLSQYASFIDGFYFQMYDFYVENSATLKLVENSNVDINDASSLIALLNSQVWSRYLPFYESPQANFMWSIQNSAEASCLYPLGRANCGTKQDFGIWSLDAFMSFLSSLKQMYPTKFGNKPHGVFQFSFTPSSWFQPTDSSSR